MDHIPPRSLYPEKLHSKLLLIPSCRDCNEGASKDDEYLRTMIGLSAKSADEEISKPIIDATMRALSRVESRSFLRAIALDVTPTIARTDTGLFYPAIEGTVHLDRFDRVTARMIKALFFKEREQRLPDDYEVISFSLAGLKGTAVEDSNTLRRQIDVTLAGETKHIAGPQFIYWSRYYQDPNWSFWIMAIHKHHHFLGWTVRRGGLVESPPAE